MKPPAGAQSALTTIYVTRPVPASRSTYHHPRIDAGAFDCFRLHRVEWQETRRSADGAQIIYRFRAPDAESVRMALRHAGIPFDTVSIKPVARK